MKIEIVIHLFISFSTHSRVLSTDYTAPLIAKIRELAKCSRTFTHRAFWIRYSFCGLHNHFNSVDEWYFRVHPFAKKNPLLSFRHYAISFKAVLFPLQGRAATGHSEEPALLEGMLGRVNAMMWVVYFENLVHFTSWELVTAPWSQIYFHFLVLFPMQLPIERNNKKQYFPGAKSGSQKWIFG